MSNVNARLVSIVNNLGGRSLLSESNVSPEVASDILLDQLEALIAHHGVGEKTEDQSESSNSGDLFARLLERIEFPHEISGITLAHIVCERRGNGSLIVQVDRAYYMNNKDPMYRLLKIIRDGVAAKGGKAQFMRSTPISPAYMLITSK